MNVLDENILESHFVRRVLCAPDFNTQAKRMGAVTRVTHSGLTVWRLHADKEIRLAWLTAK